MQLHLRRHAASAFCANHGRLDGVDPVREKLHRRETLVDAKHGRRAAEVSFVPDMLQLSAVTRPLQSVLPQVCIVGTYSVLFRVEGVLANRHLNNIKAT
jgi:hypothetical protein